MTIRRCAVPPLGGSIPPSTGSRGENVLEAVNVSRRDDHVRSRDRIPRTCHTIHFTEYGWVIVTADVPEYGSAAPAGQPELDQDEEKRVELASGLHEYGMESRDALALPMPR